MKEVGENIRVEVETWNREYADGYEYYYIDDGTFLFLTTPPFSTNSLPASN